VWATGNLEDFRSAVEPRDPYNEPTRSHVWEGAEDAEARVLVFWEGGFAARALRKGQTLTIGRSQECDLHVIHPSVSRRHVAIHAGPPVVVEDLGSANGTRLLGRRLAANAREVVGEGAVIEAGSAMIVVQLVGSRAVPPWAQGRDATALAELQSAGKPLTPMQRVLRLADLVAASDLGILVSGETGVGKEVLADRLHKGSPRANGPFVRLNVAALPETLLESELFGHERGAFTGAVKSKPGLLETGSGGTVFLDEVGELPLATQAKLLRVLEAREVLRIGGLAPRPIDVRFLAATNRDLQALVAAGSFRGDLYFRLNGITLHVPPLRERRDEIVPLAHALAAQVKSATPPRFTAEALHALEQHDWPGNVRELRNTVERACVLAAGQPIQREHLRLEAARPAPVAHVAPSPPLPKPAVPAPPGTGLRDEVELYERRRVEEALERAGGNQTRAAEALGMSRRALVTRLSSYGMTRKRSPGSG
jgi:two-component system response regulator AtoC